MIDIHSHIIFNVDDGSKSLEQSIKYLKQIKKIGMEKVICTPHMKYGKKEKAIKIVNNFKMLREEAKKLDIDLYLGNEIMYSTNTIDLLKTKKITTLNKTKYILVEFKRNETMNIEQLLDNLESLIEEGYKVILAHPEVYVNYRNIENMKRIKEIGVLLQMDATSVLISKSSIKTRKFAKKMLSERLIDFVASDSHCTKKRDFLSMKTAYKKIKRKYTKDYADVIFNNNSLELMM